MTQFYYTDGKERYGPLSMEELRTKNITPQTLVWKEGLSDWVQAGQMEELQALFQASEMAAPVVPVSQMIGEKPPKNWLVESILVTLLCCLPFGVVGIIFSTKVDTLWNTGQREEAIKASQDAAKWVKIGFFVGIGAYILYGIMLMMGIFAGLGSAGFSS